LQNSGNPHHLDLAFERERDRLIRFCLRYTGNRQAAEDLVQETFLEAWRHRNKLVDPAGVAPWLTAFARNVCLRWRRQQRRVGPFYQELTARIDEVADNVDIEQELEWAETAVFVWTALDHLPVDTREILVCRYFRHESLSTMASRLKISEAALSMRLTRGKQLLKRRMVEQPHADLVVDIESSERATGRETRMWCINCGRERLLMQVAVPSGMISFRCPSCDPDPRDIQSSFRLENPFFADLLNGLVNPRSILNRTMRWSRSYFRSALDSNGTACTACGKPVPLQRTGSSGSGLETLLVSCPACGEMCCTSFHGYISSQPEIQSFWRTEERIRRLPEYVVEHEGKEAVVSRYESVRSRATVDIVATPDTYRIVQTS
jgi:RNA polymerase sigma factor (sigma-70 family)